MRAGSLARTTAASSLLAGAGAALAALPDVSFSFQILPPLLGTARTNFVPLSSSRSSSAVVARRSGFIDKRDSWSAHRMLHENDEDPERRREQPFVTACGPQFSDACQDAMNSFLQKHGPFFDDGTDDDVVFDDDERQARSDFGADEKGRSEKLSSKPKEGEYIDAEIVSKEGSAEPSNATTEKFPCESTKQLWRDHE